MARCVCMMEELGKSQLHPGLSPSHVGNTHPMPAMKLVMKEAIRVLHVLYCPRAKRSSLVHSPGISVRQLEKRQDSLSDTMNVYGVCAIRVILRNQIGKKHPPLPELITTIDRYFKFISVKKFRNAV